MSTEPLRPFISGRAAFASAGRLYARDVVRDREILARQSVEEFARERLARREADRVHEDVETIPVLAEIGEQRFDLRVARDVAGQHDIRAESLGGFVDARLELVVDVGERELRAFAMHRVGDAPGDRAVADDARDQCALAVQKSHEASRQKTGIRVEEF